MVEDEAKKRQEGHHHWSPLVTTTTTGHQRATCNVQSANQCKVQFRAFKGSVQSSVQNARPCVYFLRRRRNREGAGRTFLKRVWTFEDTFSPSVPLDLGGGFFLEP